MKSNFPFLLSELDVEGQPYVATPEASAQPSDTVSDDGIGAQDFHSDEEDVVYSNIHSGSDSNLTSSSGEDDDDDDSASASGMENENIVEGKYIEFTICRHGRVIWHSMQGVLILVIISFQLTYQSYIQWA
jgi:hypothetical protein